MTSPGLDRLHTALADRYAVERELGQGGMAPLKARPSFQKLIRRGS